jgi:hypothetical protein
MLPPRIRDLSDEVFEAIRQRAYKGRHIWHDYLEQRCAELNVPFDPGITQTACVDLRDLGYEFVNGEFVERKQRKRKTTNGALDINDRVRDSQIR